MYAFCGLHVFLSVATLTLESVDDGVDGAKGTCPAAASAAMDDDRSFPVPCGLIVRSAVSSAGLVAADDGAAVLDQAEHVGRMGGRAKVGPIGILELGDLAKRLEGVVGVREGEFADDDFGSFEVSWSCRLSIR